MVSVVWSLIALSMGFLIYASAAMVANMAPVPIREKVGRWYFAQAMKSYRQVGMIRRVLGGYELLPISIDDEQKTANVTLSSGMISDDKTLPFRDPDNRIKRLFNKPVAVVAEPLPAVISPELAEIGYWTGEKETTRGLQQESGNGTRVDPYVKMSDGMRVVDPIDALSVVPKATQPESVKTVEELTKERFSEYGDGLGMAETFATLTAFAFGVGAVAGIAYLNNQILDGSGSSLPKGPTIPMDVALDVVVMLL